MVLTGRRKIKTDTAVITSDNVTEVLAKAYKRHLINRGEIEYLWRYYRGLQPILERTKIIEDDICNRLVINRASEIVTFKSGYLMGEPVQYISRGDAPETAEAINKLNDYVFAEEKQSKDKELADWFHICGTAYRMVLPDWDTDDEDESPFEIYTLDPRDTFVIYDNSPAGKPVMGVTYVRKTVDDHNYNPPMQVQKNVFSCYTENEFFVICDGKITEHNYHALGDVPIIEYPLNMARTGAFEIVHDLLNAINLCESDRVDGVEKFIQSLMLFHNVDISTSDYEALKERGAIKYSDIDPQKKAEIGYLNMELNQSQTQVLQDSMYQTVLTIVGMPNRNGGSSTSDTGSAVIMRDGWSAAEARAKDTELMFKRSERQFLRILLRICSPSRGMKLKVSNIEIRFTRRNYENILEKAEVLTMMLGNDRIHPRLAFEHCGLFVDSDLAYTVSEEYHRSLAEAAAAIPEDTEREEEEKDYDLTA